MPDFHRIPAAMYEPGQTYQVVIRSSGRVTGVRYSMVDQSPNVANRIHPSDVPPAEDYMLYDSDGRALLGNQSCWQTAPLNHNDGRVPYWDVGRFMVLRFKTSSMMMPGTYEIHVEVERGVSQAAPAPY